MQTDQTFIPTPPASRSLRSSGSQEGPRRHPEQPPDKAVRLEGPRIVASATCPDPALAPSPDADTGALDEGLQSGYKGRLRSRKRKVDYRILTLEELDALERQSRRGASAISASRAESASSVGSDPEQQDGEQGDEPDAQSAVVGLNGAVGSSPMLVEEEDDEFLDDAPPAPPSIYPSSLLQHDAQNLYSLVRYARIYQVPSSLRATTNDAASRNSSGTVPATSNASSSQRQGQSLQPTKVLGGPVEDKPARTRTARKQSAPRRRDTAKGCETLIVAHGTTVCQRTHEVPA